MAHCCDDYKSNALIHPSDGYKSNALIYLMGEGRLAAVLFLAAFLARYSTCLGTLIFGTDGGQFLYMAEMMSGARFGEALALSYHPMYPLLTAAAKTFFGSAERAGFWVSMILGSGAVVPLFFMSRHVFGRPAGFITGLAYAFHPYTLDLHADVMTEGTFSFFLFWSIWLGWKALDDASVERAVLAGLSAAAAFLTRAEGILAMVLLPAWQFVELLRRRDRWADRLGGIGLGAAASVLLIFPFLLWVKWAHPQKKWALSAKYSVIQAGSTIIPGGHDAIEDRHQHRTGIFADRYGKLALSIVRMMYYAGIPFYIMGLAGIGGLDRRRAIYYFSFPLLYIAGLLWSLQKVPYMSYRYVVPPMNLLAAVMATGVVLTIRLIARRWPERRWVLASQIIVAIVTVAVGIRALGVHRAESNVARAAAAWIRSQGGTEKGLFASLDQVGHLAGTRTLWFPPDWNGFIKALNERLTDYVLYTDKDLASGVPQYIGRLMECDRLEPPHVIRDARTVYIQRVKR